MASPKLDPLFLHEELVISTLEPSRVTAAFDRARNMPQLPAMQQYALASTFMDFLQEINIPELQRSLLQDSLTIGQLVGIQQAFYFRRAKERYRTGDKPIDFYAQLNTDNKIRIEGSLNSLRLVTNSAAGQLSGRRNVYIVGTVIDRTDQVIKLKPFIIGVRFYFDQEESKKVGHPIPQDRRIHPSQVDQFNKVDFRKNASAADRRNVLRLPERAVKESFADILGEPYVPKDWGGEKSDLYSARLFIEGKQMSSAWLFKGGPGFSGQMTVAALGKNGDQIDRLFSEPADLLILQHCNSITSAVINMMQTYASNMHSPRQYMIIDGEDTARILRAYGVLSAVSPGT